MKVRELEDIVADRCEQTVKTRSTRAHLQDGGKMEACATKRGFRGNTQWMWLTGKKELLPNPPFGSDDIDQCLDAYASEDSKIGIYGCHGFGGKQEWTYDASTKIIGHGKFCLGQVGKSVRVQTCKSGDASQQWQWLKIEGFEMPHLPK